MTRFFDFYKDYTPGQLAGDEYFRQWVLQADETLEQFWSAYLQAYPDRAATLARARELVTIETLDRRNVRPLSTEEKATLKADIFNRLGLEMARKETPVVPMKRTRLAWTSAAVLLVAATAVYLFRGTLTPGPGKTTLLAERTGLNEMKTIILPDSSVVVLNAGSTLQYNPGFASGDHREVWLKGNAFFQVKHSEDIRKFVVHAGAVSVTVLGTQLNVDARTASTEVALITGKVKVAVDGHEQTPLFLQPGYKASLDTLSHSLSLSTVNTQLYTAWKDGKWTFWHTSMEDIGTLISEYYGIAVTFRNPKTKLLSINAVMAVGSLQKLIPVLEQTLHIKMTLSENRLVIE